jgi:hypothetical protein
VIGNLALGEDGKMGRPGQSAAVPPRQDRGIPLPGRAARGAHRAAQGRVGSCSARLRRPISRTRRQPARRRAPAAHRGG